MTSLRVVFVHFHARTRQRQKCLFKATFEPKLADFVPLIPKKSAKIRPKFLPTRAEFDQFSRK